MARPQRHNVDYFPHYCDHGKILFILEKNWGNDGYAFFYKLYELLGKANGHTVNLNSAEAWEYFAAKTGVSGPVIEEIMQKLVVLGVIDGELWSRRIVWSQAFVDSLVSVYHKREGFIPQKPALPERKPALSEVKPTETPISPDNNPQSIGSIGSILKQSETADAAFIQKEIDATCKGLVKTKFPEVYKFVGAMQKKKMNPEAILHVLRRILQYPTDDPWAYGASIIAKENGNYNERAHTAKAQAIKEDEKQDVARLLQGIGKPF